MSRLAACDPSAGLRAGAGENEEPVCSNFALTYWLPT
jgi:hypothetical protein